MDISKEEFWTLEEVAQKLKVSPTTVYRMAQTGKLPGVKIGRVWRFSRVRILDLFNKK